MSEAPRLFTDLPAALIEEVIGQATNAGDLLLSRFENLKEERSRYRQALQDSHLVHHESELGYPPAPTTCATDGSYAIERLLTADLVAAAAVAVEGLTPPSETRYWVEPWHECFVAVEPHNEDTTTVLRALMLGRELTLAVKAPHDVVMIDGTLTLPIIYLNQALNKAPTVTKLNCAVEFVRAAKSYLEAYLTILTSERADKQFIALPKYSTRREIGNAVGWTGEHDDRGLLTLLLNPGEFTKPLPLEQPADEWHLNTKIIGEDGKELGERIVNALHRVHTTYYKPHPWLPVLRIELPGAVATNPHRLALVLLGLKHQCATAAMLEPYPLYLADRTVKALARSVPTFRQVATQRISEQYNGDISEVFFAMHGYRSESGA